MLHDRYSFRCVHLTGFIRYLLIEALYFCTKISWLGMCLRRFKMPCFGIFCGDLKSARIVLTPNCTQPGPDSAPRPDPEEVVRNEGSRRSWNRGFVTIATAAWLSPHGLPLFTTIRMSSLAKPESEDKRKRAIQSSSCNPINSTEIQCAVFLTIKSLIRSGASLSHYNTCAHR